MRDNPCRKVGEPPLHTLLRRRRQELSLLQADIAEALNVSPECVTLWECGRRRMELSKIPRLARALHIDPRALCAKALAEFHPAFYATLFAHDAAPANIQPVPE
jgi:transcriptional regulator with XRE-family HTH domain